MKNAFSRGCRSWQPLFYLLRIFNQIINAKEVERIERTLSSDDMRDEEHLLRY